LAALVVCGVGRKPVHLRPMQNTAEVATQDIDYPVNVLR
jgi:hypothetical protein